MKDYEKILCLQTYCDEHMGCKGCSLRDIDKDDYCNGHIKDWDDEKVDRAYKIILEEGKNFKGFLTERRVIELRNGDRYLVVGDFLMGESDYFIKDDFTNGLTNRGLRKFDIVRIYEEIPRIGALRYKELGIIWERKPKKMTKEEIEKALGYEIEIISK